MSQLNCKYCQNKHDGWVRVPDGFGCVEWTHCVCMETNPVKERRPLIIHIRRTFEHEGAK